MALFLCVVRFYFVSLWSMKGLVVKNTGSWYVVKLEDGSMANCKIKGNFRLKGIRTTNPVAVGDELSVMYRTSRGTLCKKDGVMGWYDGTFLEEYV